MSATWFQGPAEAFIEASKAGHGKGVSVQHVLGGSAVDVTGNRGIAHTRMTIHLRATIGGVLVDVACIGRFYDFFEKREGRWAIVRRQGVYDQDRIDAVEPGAELNLDRARLVQFPAGYRHLAYLQTELGLAVKRDMPQLKDDAVQAVYAQGTQWLAGAASAFPAARH